MSPVFAHHHDEGGESLYARDEHLVVGHAGYETELDLEAHWLRSGLIGHIWVEWRDNIEAAAGTTDFHRVKLPWTADRATAEATLTACWLSIVHGARLKLAELAA